jgi:hypothetical protein
MFNISRTKVSIFYDFTKKTLTKNLKFVVLPKVQAQGLGEKNSWPSMARKKACNIRRDEETPMPGVP